MARNPNTDAIVGVQSTEQSGFRPQKINHLEERGKKNEFTGI